MWETKQTTREAFSSCSSLCCGLITVPGFVACHHGRAEHNHDNQVQYFKRGQKDQHRQKINCFFKVEEVNSGDMLTLYTLCGEIYTKTN